MKTFAQELEASLVKTIKTLVSEETLTEANGPRKIVNHQVDSALERHGFKYSHADNGRHVYKHSNGDTASLARTGMGNLSFHHHSGTEVKNGAPKPIWKSGRTGDTEIVHHLDNHYNKNMKEAVSTDQKVALKAPICNNCAKPESHHPHPGCKKFVKWDVSMVGKKPVKE